MLGSFTHGGPPLTLYVEVAMRAPLGHADWERSPVKGTLGMLGAFTYKAMFTRRYAIGICPCSTLMLTYVHIEGPPFGVSWKQSRKAGYP